MLAHANAIADGRRPVNLDQRILGVAGHLIGSGLTGASVLRRGDRNLVLQARSRHTNGPGEVVIKAVTGRDNLLLNERAALQFLGSDSATAGFVPRCLASTPDAGIIVTEHVPGETLETLLATGDAGRAAAAVTATARGLGMLHALTVGRRDEWLACAGARNVPPARQAEAFRELVPAILKFCERALVRPPPTFRDEIGRIAQTLERPGEWLAFTVGDLAPSNVILAANGPTFVDLEYADFRHAGYDAAFWHSICPFPESVAVAADRAYRDGWRDARASRGTTSQAHVDDGLEQTTLLAAHRAFWSLTWGAGQLWEADFEEMPGVSARRLRRLWLRGFGRLARRAGVLPAAATVAAELDSALGVLWPDTNSPAVLFPAFGAAD